MATVDLINVGKQYANQIILEHININVEKGEFVVVVGPSGCGKSTLLRLVAGLDTLSGGKILINNQCVNTIPAAKRDMAMVFQNYALYPHMTVFQNIAYSLKMRKLKTSVIEEQVKKVAGLLQLETLMQRKPRELSGGQCQRVAMGRAIVRSPAVFLFDEPLSNLDAKLRTEMRHEIKKLHQQLNTTCLYVTHDQTEAMTMGSRVLVLNKGRMEQIGTPQNLYQKPASLFVAGFTGHYPINFLVAQTDKRSHCVVSELGISFPLPSLLQPLLADKKVMIAIRPENLQLTNLHSPGSVPIIIKFIDEMGADRLIYAQSDCGRTSFVIRTTHDQVIAQEKAAVKFIINKANLFDYHTEQRIGGWHD